MILFGTAGSLVRMIERHGPDTRVVEVAAAAKCRRRLYLCQECGSICDPAKPETIWADDQGVYCEIHGRAKFLEIVSGHVAGRG